VPILNQQASNRVIQRPNSLTFASVSPGMSVKEMMPIGSNNDSQNHGSNHDAKKVTKTDQTAITTFCVAQMTKQLDLLQCALLATNGRSSATSSNGSDNNSGSNGDPDGHAQDDSVSQALLALAELKKIRDVLRGTLTL
jgi:hypothetical protein